MNVAAHQEKEKDEKTGKRKAGEERRQTDVKEAACYPSAVVQGAARQKNDFREWSARGNWDPREGQQPFRPNQNGVGDRTTTLRRLMIGEFNFARFSCIYYIYDRNFALHYPKRSKSIRVLGIYRKSVMMIRVKVYSNSELV